MRIFFFALSKTNKFDFLFINFYNEIKNKRNRKLNLGLKNKVALVTAASKGIGKAVAELLTEEECKVAICSSNKQNLIKASNQIKELYKVEPLWLVCDINNPKEIEETVKAVKKELGDIDILINNCGGPKPGFFEDLRDEDWEYGYNQVLMSAIRFIRQVLPGMKLNNWGRIINITSLSVKQPVDNLILSNSFRSALTAAAKTLSKDVGKFNITVNNVAPGYTLTSRLYELAMDKAKKENSTHEDVLAEMAKNSSVRRVANPEEVASAVLYLASNRASYITGSTIAVDGGVIKSTY